MVPFVGYVKRRNYFKLPKYEREFYELSVGTLVSVNVKKTVGVMRMSFISRIQSCNRIYIPKLVRQRLNLAVGNLLEINVVQLPDKNPFCLAVMYRLQLLYVNLPLFVGLFAGSVCSI